MMNTKSLFLKNFQNSWQRNQLNGKIKYSFSGKNEDPYSKMCREQKEMTKLKDEQNRKNRSTKDYLLISSLALFILTSTFVVGKKVLTVIQDFYNPYANPNPDSKKK